MEKGKGSRGKSSASGEGSPAASNRYLHDVEKALLERPTMSVAAKLTLGFLLLFLLSAGMTVTAWLTLDRIERKLKFLETADKYTTEIQQARRFEKNYFHYGTNLDDAIEHVQNATRLLHSGKAELESVIGEAPFSRVEQHLRKYSALLEKLKHLEDETSSRGLPHHPAIEADLREHGALMVSQALNLAEEEREEAELMMRLFKRVPLVFLVVLLPVGIYAANVLARQILGPLGRMMTATQRIAGGDFTPIPPARRFRDEFTSLAVALNHMMEELQRRHDILVRSHKLRAVGTLTAGIAHELNNPINNITLTAAMLEEDYTDLDDPSRLDMIRDLMTQAERASRIVRSLLDFARESEMDSQLLDVGELVNETVRLARNEIKLKKVKVEVRVTTVSQVYGDRQLLSQVFLNLILNALDALSKGGLLAIDVQKYQQQQEFVAVLFKDNGKGVSEHVRDSVFDPFFTTKQTGKGTGLGLSVSLGIAKKHGGDIRVESTLGVGTVFTVLLPVASIPARLVVEEPDEAEDI